MKKGLLIFIMGVSGAGKNTMIGLLAQKNSLFKEIISYTTRKPRENEKDGKNYHYISQEEFLKDIEQNMFLEYAVLHGGQYYYGTKRNDIIHGLENGDILLKEIDMQGVEKLAKNETEIYDQSFRIFLDLPEDVMTTRITNRASISQEELQKRLHSAIHERELAQKYASIILSAEGTVDEVYVAISEAIQIFLDTR